MDSPRFTTDLAYLESHYTFLVQRIAEIESSQLTLCESLQLLLDAQTRLARVNGTKGALLKQKAESVHAKNVGLRVMEAVGQVSCGEVVAKENYAPYSQADLPLLKFAPLSSVDVERSFSMLRASMRDNRERLSLESARMLVVVHCNVHLF